jgi:hypothetical protein
MTITIMLPLRIPNRAGKQEKRGRNRGGDAGNPF